jgi:hypothetical protein
MTNKYTINNKKYISVTQITGIIDKSEMLMKWAVDKTVDKIKREINGLTELDKETINTILSYQNAYKEVSNTALDIGSVVHDLIDKRIRKERDCLYYDGLYYDNEEVNNCIKAFCKFEKENDLLYLASELVVCNEKKRYAGTLDCEVDINNKTYFIDWKTSKDIYNEYWLQISAYKYARESMKGYYNISKYASEESVWYNELVRDEIGIGIVRLDKDTGDYEMKLIDDQKVIKRYYKAFEGLLQYWFNARNRRGF